MENIGDTMYFLAHMYSILEVLPETMLKEETLKPIIIGSWSPDAGYFPFYSPKLKIFGHYETPPINLFQKTKQENQAYTLGWKLHILCDDLIHKKPFFANGQPLCTTIIRNNGLVEYYQTAKQHLGREIGLDLFIYEKLLSSSNLNMLWFKDFYKKPKIAYPGFSKLQNYVYLYVNKFLPLIGGKSHMSKRLRKIIDYEFFKNAYMKEKIITFLKKAQIKCKEMIDDELKQ